MENKLLFLSFVAVTLIRLRKKRNKPRKMWVKKWLLKRHQYSHVNILKELRFHPKDWHNYMRMTEPTYLKLLKLVSPKIQKHDTNMRQAVSIHERLSATLRFLATGRSYEDLKFSSIISPQLLGRIIPETCAAIYEACHDYCKVPETWLRVYPAPMYPGEPTTSVAFRCICCQLGLTACLVLWTMVWVFVIQSFEGPHEEEVTQKFEKEQNQLVIDLATELRQITPVSPKWRKAIIRRIEESRQLTLIAAGNGAKLHPGQYWGLSGTFLFTVYVMTALGFGAPVPQTVYGRCLSLLYAVFAVPIHVYLMMNASTCAVAHINHCLVQLKKNLNGKPDLIKSRNRATINNSTESPNCSSNFDGKTSKRRRKLYHLVCIITAGHCIPLASVVYYVIGVLVFGLWRNSDIMEVFFFPLQFTTGGGLSSVEDHFRILYGFYVEGAMALLTCLLTTLRRKSGNSVNEMTVKYRLFAHDKCGS